MTPQMPKKIEVSQLPIIVSELSLYKAFNWLCACSKRQADISLERMVAINFSTMVCFNTLYQTLNTVNCQSKFQFARLNSGFNEKQTKG